MSPAPHHYQQPSLHVKVEQPPLLPVPEIVAPVGEEKAEQPVVTPQPPQQAIVPPEGTHPKIAVIIDDMGLDMRDSRRAVTLPAFITLSYMPYATQLRDQTRQARDAGHELLLHMPMEPVGHEDPGPGALLVGLPPEELQRRFETALASFTGFDGVNNHMGSKFTADAVGMELVVAALQERNLFFLDSRTSGKTVGESIARAHGLLTIGRDVFLDDDMSPAAIRRQMKVAEHVALRKGTAVVIGHPHPVTLDALSLWINDAQSRGFVFVPVRGMVAIP